MRRSGVAAVAAPQGEDLLTGDLVSLSLQVAFQRCGARHSSYCDLDHRWLLPTELATQRWLRGEPLNSGHLAWQLAPFNGQEKGAWIEVRSAIRAP